jgi:hypothetical protein
MVRCDECGGGTIRTLVNAHHPLLMFVTNDATEAGE